MSPSVQLGLAGRSVISSRVLWRTFTHVGHGFGDESQLSGLVDRTAQLPSVAAVRRHGFGGWDGHTETRNKINSRHKYSPLMKPGLSAAAAAAWQQPTQS